MCLRVAQYRQLNVLAGGKERCQKERCQDPLIQEKGPDTVT
jgi:hypothetical protein